MTITQTTAAFRGDAALQQPIATIRPHRALPMRRPDRPTASRRQAVVKTRRPGTLAIGRNA